MKIDIALETMKNDDYFKAVEYLSRQSNPLEILDAFKEIAKRLYWESKDMAGVIIFSGAAIQFAQMSVQSVSVKEDVVQKIKEKEEENLRLQKETEIMKIIKDARKYALNKKFRKAEESLRDVFMRSRAFCCLFFAFSSKE